MDNKWTAILFFLAGVSVGRNWPKIKKFVLPYLKDIEKGAAVGYAGLLKLFVEQKEKLEDILAESKVKEPKVAIEKATKKAGRTAKVTKVSPTLPLRAPRGKTASKSAKPRTLEDILAEVTIKKRKGAIKKAAKTAARTAKVTRVSTTLPARVPRGKTTLKSGGPGILEDILADESLAVL